VIDQSVLLFQKAPIYESALFGLSKKYKESKIETDKLSDFFLNRLSYEPNTHKIHYERKEINSSTYKQSKSPSGYCIRTGKPIPFNSKRPFSDEAYLNWAKFSKEDYPEKFCHYTGEPSNGETTFAKPILHKNWNSAKAEHGL
jgi:hypothetical protein